MFEQPRGQREVERQLLEHALVGGRRAAGGLLDDGQAQLAEQDLADLLRRAEVERLAGDLVGLVLEREHAFRQHARLVGQPRAVDQHAMALDAAQHLARRHLDVLVDELHAGVGGQARIEHLVHLQRHLAVLARIERGAFDVDLRERDLLGALAAQVFVIEALAPQVALGEAREAVLAVRLEHVALKQRVELPAAHGDADVGEHVRVVLDVLADLGRVRVLEPRPQPRDHLVERQLVGRARVVVAQRHVRGLARLDRERDADDARAHRVERVGLGVERRQRRRVQLRDPGVELLEREDRLVLARQVGRRHDGRDGLVGRMVVEQSPVVADGHATARRAATPVSPSCFSSSWRQLRKPKRW